MAPPLSGADANDPRGPKPLDKALKRALFEDVDDFFGPAATAPRGGTRGQTYGEFAREHAQGPGHRGAGQSGLAQLYWLPSPGLEDLTQETEGLLSALLAPMRLTAVEVPRSSALGRASSALTAGRQSGSAVAQALLDALQRQAPSDAAVVLAIGTHQQQSELAAHGHLMVMMLDAQSIANEHTFFDELKYMVVNLLHGLGLVACGFYECLLNTPSRQAPPPLRLCPVCLRKLATAVSGGERWDVAKHYERMLAWVAAQGLEEEALWYRERFQVKVRSIDSRGGLRRCF
eukprot:TRINITY_DN39974_c0_g1_i4.p1 TRINITY_DN39974_c0_g1~~TRINITY_DN39974_c0_g1_i4.p1  ORF type:complete len:289 (-),score=54.50 TRINITY_DN39974_c0_g1_i4:287-1153(-)